MGIDKRNIEKNLKKRNPFFQREKTFKSFIFSH